MEDTIQAITEGTRFHLQHTVFPMVDARFSIHAGPLAQGWFLSNILAFLPANYIALSSGSRYVYSTEGFPLMLQKMM